MDNKEFKQELIQEILLNIQPSYYKNYELNKQIEIPFSICFFFHPSKQLLNTIINERRLE